MNKALHVFVYLFLIGVGVAYWYEFQLHDKRMESNDRSQVMIDWIVKTMAPLVEAGNDYDKREDKADEVVEWNKNDPDDHTQTEPDMEDVFKGIRSDYDASLGDEVHRMVTLTDNDRADLAKVYVAAGDGTWQMDGANPMKNGSPQELVLQKLQMALENQRRQLLATRRAIPKLREVVKEMTERYNALVPKLHDSIKLNISRKTQIDELTDENGKLKTKVAETESKLQETDRNLTEARENLDAAKRETDEVKESLENEVKLRESLQKKIQELIAAQQSLIASTRGTTTGIGAGAIRSVPFGDKGKIILANKEYMFAIVEFTPEAMKELKGDDLSNPLPILELGVKRPGFQGPAGEFIGRIRLSQEVSGKNYVRCDVLSNWSQDDLKPGDVIFAE